jgi:hypothetical protein
MSTTDLFDLTKLALATKRSLTEINHSIAFGTSCKSRPDIRPADTRKHFQESGDGGSIGTGASDMASSIVRFRGEQQVNTFTNGAQETPSVTALADGGWVVTWVSVGQDGAGGGIYQQCYNANGSPNGIEKRVNAVTIDSQHSPSITALSDGGWVVTWVSNGQDGSAGGIYQQRYNADGSLHAGEQKVNTYATDAQEMPSVTGLGDGGWVVSWQSAGQDGSGYGIYQQRFSADGVPASGADDLVNIGKSGDQTKPSITTLKDGGWVVTWQNGNDLLQRIYNADGTPRFSTVVNLDNIDSSERSPSVTALEDGGWVVTLESTKDGSVWGIYQQRFGSDGNAGTYPEQKVNTRTWQSQDAPSVTALADGGWIVTWRSFAQDAGGPLRRMMEQPTWAFISNASAPMALHSTGNSWSTFTRASTRMLRASRA